MEDAVLAEIDAHPALMLHPVVVGGAGAVDPCLEILNDPDLEALVEDAMVARPRKKQKYEQRSDALIAHAVKSKKFIVAKRAEEKAVVEKERAEEESNLAAFLSTDATRVLNKKLNRGYRSMHPERACQLICRFACLTRRRCDRSMTHRQNKVAELMMRTVQPLQEQAFWKLQTAATFAALPSEDLPTDAVGIAAMPHPELKAMPEEVLMLCHQFDTTKQRASEAFAEQHIPSKKSNKEHGYVTTTVLMQRLQTVRSVFRQGRLLADLPPEPFVMPATFLKEQNSDFDLEGALQHLPFDFEKDEDLLRLAASADSVWIIWTLDRDIANALGIQWLFDRLEALELSNVFPLHMPCLTHGTQLVKERYSHAKAQGTQSISLCRQFRHHGFRKNARKCLKAHVTKHCRIRCCRRPPSWAPLASKILRLMFPEEEVEAEWWCSIYAIEVGSAAIRRKKFKHGAYYRRAAEVLKNVDFQVGPDGSMRVVWCHWCVDESDFVLGCEVFSVSPVL